MGGRRIPNERLRTLLALAGWSGGDLARAVNAVAAETGLHLEYGRASVGQWLAGGCPRAPVPSLLAEALSRALDRTVTEAEAGLSDGRAPSGGAGEDELTVGDYFVDLVRLTGPTRRAVIKNCVYSLGALAVPGYGEIGAGMGRTAGGDHGPVRVGKGEVDAATMALRLFADAEGTLGASMVRPSLASYLAVAVTPWLRARPSSAEVRRALVSVAAELAYLCGFVCFDDELHGVAQRYYRAALQLSIEAGNIRLYAITLRSMSAQARILGHHRHALALAEAAVDSAGTKVPPVVRAFLLGQLAVSQASTGDRHRATANLLTAERDLSAPANTPTATGAYHYASLAHQRAAMLACLGDRNGAITALQDSIRHRPVTERRACVIMLARLAELQLNRGQVEEAASTWSRFLDMYPTVRSGRARTAMGTLRARLRPHQQLPAVKSLLGRASVLFD